MGTYATTTSLQTVMIGTTFNSVTTALATKCITWAEAEVNKYLSKRYDISGSAFATSTAIPPMVTTWTEWLAQGYMYQQNSRGSDESMTRGQSYIDRAIDNLKLVADLKLDVLDSTGSALTESANASYRIQCSTSDYPNTFNEDDELNWAVSSDKLTDIANDRD